MHTNNTAPTVREHMTDHMTEQRALRTIGAAIAKTVMRRVSGKQLSAVIDALKAYDDAKLELDRACNEIIAEVL